MNRNILRYFTPYQFYFRLSGQKLARFTHGFNICQTVIKGKTLFKFANFNFCQSNTLIPSVRHHRPTDPGLIFLETIGLTTPMEVTVSSMSNQDYLVTSSPNVPTHMMLSLRDIFTESGCLTYTSTKPVDDIQIPISIQNPLNDPFNGSLDSGFCQEVTKLYNNLTPIVREYMLTQMLELYMRKLEFCIPDKEPFYTYDAVSMNSCNYYSDPAKNKAIEFVKKFGRQRHILTGSLEFNYNYNGGISLFQDCPMQSFLLNSQISCPRMKTMINNLFMSNGDVTTKYSDWYRYNCYYKYKSKSVPFWKMIGLKESIDAFGIKTKVDPDNWY